MTITATGTISLGDLRTEFVGGSSAISFGDLYRGGSNIRKLAGDNTATNDAASVPTSGVIDFSDFYGTAKSFTKTYSAGATDQDASAIFGTDYSVNYPKNIVVNSGVELGATSTSQEALEIDSGGTGTITITNNGTLSGAGGAAGADGGDAFEAAVTCTFINNGTVRAGGGGGGTGGDGSYNSDTNYSPYGNRYWRQGTNYVSLYHPAGVLVYSGNSAPYYNTGIVPSGNVSYHRTNFAFPAPYGLYAYNYFVRQAVSTTGGSGGVGAGYSQPAGTGVAGGTNAGDGGDGGAFGASGDSGANGNVSNGSAGGAAGNYLRGSSFVTFTNNGTVQGGTV